MKKYFIYMFSSYFNNHKYVWTESFLVGAIIFLGRNLLMPNIKKKNALDTETQGHFI